MHTDLLPTLHRYKYLSKKILNTIKTSPEWVYQYAFHIIEGRFPEGEDSIKTDPEWAYKYARDLLGYNDRAASKWTYD